MSSALKIKCYKSDLNPPEKAFSQRVNSFVSLSVCSWVSSFDTSTEWKRSPSFGQSRWNGSVCGALFVVYSAQSMPSFFDCLCARSYLQRNRSWVSIQRLKGLCYIWDNDVKRKKKEGWLRHNAAWWYMYCCVKPQVYRLEHTEVWDLKVQNDWKSLPKMNQMRAKCKTILCFN